MTIICPMIDAAVTPFRAREILVSLAKYHGLKVVPHSVELDGLVMQTEQHTIKAFYKYFTACICPSNAILLCIIEEIKSNGKSSSIR